MGNTEWVAAAVCSILITFKSTEARLPGGSPHKAATPDPPQRLLLSSIFMDSQELTPTSWLPTQLGRNMSSFVMMWWGKKAVSEQGPTVPKYVGGLCMCVAYDTCGLMAHNACRHVVFLMCVHEYVTCYMFVHAICTYVCVLCVVYV